MSVCLSVCPSDDTFESPDVGSSLFAHPVYLQGIRVEFVFEGHLVKVKVTGAKKVENSYFRKVKLRLIITDYNSGSITVRVARDFRLWRIERCDRHLYRVTGIQRELICVTKCTHSLVVGLRLK